MIVYSTNGGGGLLLFLLLFLGMFVVVPALLLRGATRTVRTGGLPGGWPQQDEQSAPQPRAVAAADVRSLVDRLGHDVRSLDPGADAVSRQAMADASERYSTANGLLEQARSQDQLRTAWLAAVEGLHATRLVRERLGLDPGPAPALPPGTGPRLEQRSRVVVDGREHVGSPRYEPGYSHWFPGGQYGGRYVPGGWYAEPFWPGSLVLGVLSGYALGSLMTGGLLGGYGYGYDGGYGDGDWGAGGDWGGDVGGGSWDSGGDWGGDIGGGGWGDGGGDFGGGGGGDW